MKRRILFYEVNPLYYKDANNDGIGDLKGLLQQTSYFAHLGIEAIIIPNILSMYSIDPMHNDSYKKIVPEIGTMDDFRKFSKKMKLMGIKIIIDINIGSIKETHEWFRQARTNKKKFEEIITASQKDELNNDIVDEELNDEESKLAGVTKLNTHTNTYYFVNQETSEVSLNWKSGTIRTMFIDVARFWNELGVEGFRFSNFEYLGQVKPNNKLEETTTLIELRRFYRSLKEMNENFIIIGKSEIISPAESKLLLADNTKVLDYFQPLDYSKMGLDAKYGNDVIGKFQLSKLVKLLRKFIKGEESVLAFGTNITGRPISRWGGNGEFNIELTKTLAIIQLFYSSSPLIYYGEEIGAKNMGLTYLDDFQDPTLYERKRALQDKGIDIKDFMAAQVLQNPINSHTLMAWTDKKNGGFSRKEKTIVPASNSYRDINVLNQYTSDNTPLNFYRKIIEFTKSSEIKEILSDGISNIKILKLGKGVLQITHRLDDKEIIILSNFSNKPKNISAPAEFEILISSYYGKTYYRGISALHEYETIVFTKNIETKLKTNIEPLLPKRTPKKEQNLDITSERPKQNKREIQSSKITIEKEKHVSQLLGKWAIGESSSHIVATINNEHDETKNNSIIKPDTIENPDSLEENLLDENDQTIKSNNIESTVQMAIKNRENTKDDAKIEEHGNKNIKNDDDYMAGTIEMITNDIESTTEMNFDDSILDSESKDVDIHDDHQTHKAAREIKNSINDIVDHEDEFLEHEREQSVNPNDNNHSSKYKQK